MKKSGRFAFRLLAAVWLFHFPVIGTPGESELNLLPVPANFSRGTGKLAVDDSFRVQMDRDSLGAFPLGEYEVTVIITKYEPDAEIAWTIGGELLDPPIGHIYGYRLEAIEGGTLVTSYYDWSEIHDNYREAGIFPVISENHLRATLGILARTVAPGAGRPGA